MKHKKMIKMITPILTYVEYVKLLQLAESFNQTHTVFIGLSPGTNFAKL